MTHNIVRYKGTVVGYLVNHQTMAMTLLCCQTYSVFIIVNEGEQLTTAQ